MFQALQPKRVHPLVYQDSSISTISMDILNDGCEIVDIIDSDAAERSYNIPDASEDSMDENRSFLELSAELTMPDNLSSNDSDVVGIDIIQWVLST